MTSTKSNARKSNPLAKEWSRKERKAMSRGLRNTHRRQAIKDQGR